MQRRLYSEGPQCCLEHHGSRHEWPKRGAPALLRNSNCMGNCGNHPICLQSFVPCEDESFAYRSRMFCSQQQAVDEVIDVDQLMDILAIANYEEDALVDAPE